MRRLHALALAAFCLLSGSSWLVDAAAPSEFPILQGQSLRYAVIAFVAFVAWLLKFFRKPARINVRWDISPWRKVSLAGLMLLALPVFLSAWSIDAASFPALLTLTPLLIVVVSSSVAGFAGDRARMFPAVAGATGGLLVLPLRFPVNARECAPFLVLLAAVALTAWASVWAHRLLQGCDLLWAAVMVCAPAALVLGLAAYQTHPATPSIHSLLAELLRCTLLDLPQLLLLVWLLREASPVQLASRFLQVPVIAILEGLVLVRPQVDLRFAAGLVLMAGSAAMLLFGEGEQEPGTSSLLDLS